MLTIHKYVIHEIHKQANMQGAILDLSLSLGGVNDFAYTLVLETHNSFTQAPGLKNTKFEAGHSTVFLTGLKAYLSSGSDEAFYVFTVDSLNDLKAKIEKEQFAVGGYYLFVDYVYDSKRFISVVLLRKKSGVNFQKINGIYSPISGETINIEKIGMGFRLNHAIFVSQDADTNYVALVTNQKDRISDYFKTWVQAAGIISNENNTLLFVRLINSIDIPKDDKGNTAFASREEFKKAVYEVIENSPQKVVNLPLLSQHFYSNGIEIIKFAQDHAIIIDSEFKRTNRLKKLVTIRARVPGIELAIDYDRLNPDEVDVLNDTVIIRSIALVDQINEQRIEG